eukprot:Pgem_evm1s3120
MISYTLVTIALSVLQSVKGQNDAPTIPATPVTSSNFSCDQTGPDVLYLGPFQNEEFNKNTTLHPVCECSGNTKIYANGACYTDLKKVMESSLFETVIYIGSNIDVSEPISIWQDLSLYGIYCDGINTQPIITSSVSGTEDKYTGIPIDRVGLFQFTNNKYQTLRMKNLDFQSMNYRDTTTAPIVAPVILAPLNNTDHWSSLDIRNCQFKNFISRNGGSVIKMNIAYRVNIDKDTKFINNKVEGYCDCYEGGAVSADYVSEVSRVEINSEFTNNEARFKYIWPNRTGSEHAHGGAISLTYVDGIVNINGNFVNNSGNDGGAITIMGVTLGTVKIGGLFRNNFVVENGAGARGGAIRVFNISGTVEVTGKYVNNSAVTDRGAVFAGNYLYGENSVLYLNGDFVNNTALKNGGVVSMIGSSSEKEIYLAGKLIIDEVSTFDNNRVTSNEKTDILWIKNGPTLNEKQWDEYNDQNLIITKGGIQTANETNMPTITPEVAPDIVDCSTRTNPNDPNIPVDPNTPNDPNDPNVPNDPDDEVANPQAGGNSVSHIKATYTLLLTIPLISLIF